jgi:mitogen-activated protein kinase 15
MISVYGGSKWFSHQYQGRSQSLREILASSPPDAIDLVEQLLVLNPQKRLTASEALKHPYVAR